MKRLPREKTFRWVWIISQVDSGNRSGGSIDEHSGGFT
jgi:hypothetical protein